jgi:hypothetical protein
MQGERDTGPRARARSCLSVPRGEVNTPQTPGAEGGCLPGGASGETAWGTTQDGTT